jgi:hypothetical protein
MNKSLLCALSVTFMVLFSFTTQAARQYGWNKTIDIDWQYGGPNIQVNERTALYVTHITSNHVNSFGYYTYPAGQGFDVNSIAAVGLNSNTKTYIGDFDAGTNVGFWMQTNKGTFYTSQMFNPWGVSNSIVLGDTSDGFPVIGMEDDFWGRWKYDDMVFAVSTGEAQPPPGQPLPGVVLSTMLGLFASGIILLKRNRKS